MEYRTLGGSGCAVSTFALGTMTFGAETEEADSHAQLDGFVEAGGNLVDTADVYTGGASRGDHRPLARRRGRPTSATGSCSPPRAGSRPATVPTTSGCPAATSPRALDASLRRLGVERVDLYQVHAWDPLTPLEETLRFLDDAVRAGKVHYVGLSNFTGWQLQQAVDLAEFRGLARPVTLQPQYNLLVREIEWEVVPACQAERARPAAVVPARRRLADRQVQPRRGAHGRDPARREPRPRGRGVRPAQPQRAHLGRRRRGAGGRRRRAAPRWRRSRWPGCSPGPR